MNTYYIFTLGCQMNKSDSERLASIFDSMGMKEGKESEADLIVVNACSVRQKPIDRIWGKLKVWQKINPQAKKILTGCVLESDLKKFKKKFDLVFKIDRFDKLIAWLEKDLAPNNLDKMNDFSSYLEIIPCYQKNKQALVPIMTGCNNFCSYCAVPYTRGKE
jgi:tRNA-2-methylthio-N6-dimethylallyladenosine synthase